MMEFKEFLNSKKIDSQLFENSEPTVFNEWFLLFEKTHPESFIAQKKFSLNNYRRKYLIQR
jgi:hypothetical protein